MDLSPIRKEDLEVGKPLPWPVYDSKKNLLLKEGYVIETQSQLNALLTNGLYRNPSWVKPAAPAEKSGEKFGEKEEPPSKFDIVNFTAVSLQVGDMLQMQLSGENDQRYGVRLIGFLEKKSVLVTPPVSNDSIILMRAGQSVVMRCFSGRNAYAFTSSVLRVCSTPYPYLHLTYPIEVRGMKIRKSTRVRANVIGSVWRDDQPEKRFPCSIDDISFSGAQVNCALPLGGMGDALRLYLRVSNQGATAYVSPLALIKRCSETESPDGRKYSYGVEFHNLDQTESFALQVLVYQHLFEVS